MKTKENFNLDVENLPEVHDNLRHISSLSDLKDQIPEFDLAHNRDLRFETISVFGMGGLGKTTLARQIYHDPDIASHFDILAWVTVSQRYYEQEVLSRLPHSVRDLNHESSQESVEKLAENLYKSLKDKRYLIVLDDVWDVKILLKVKSLLPHDSNGSRILLTTRVPPVAYYANPDYAHRMRFQTPHECWNLLQHLVFDKEMCPLELVELGKVIAKNCRGLPLSLTLIGGVLYKAERTRDYWIGEIKTCSIHDVLRKFCQRETMEYLHNCLREVHGKLRHISTLSDLKDQIPEFDLAYNRGFRDKEHNDDCKKLLGLVDSPVIEVPSEAEAQSATLCKEIDMS
ncbi:unnamed protein product [Fraxinus pennsylvanica]|uniref:NB-ARC domain-containing protein n=1 Tax=Fraxinus pennsylvanica TaxID=56036 RepID=A0AAD2DN24_9LAMI|nr:unnamed protein product [Fraxinus pennsylvanica]